MLRQISLALFLAIVCRAIQARDGAETAEAKGVIQQFHQALQHHDVAAVETLVLADVVVLENGDRTTDGQIFVTIT